MRALRMLGTCGPAVVMVLGLGAFPTWNSLAAFVLAVTLEWSLNTHLWKAATFALGLGSQRPKFAGLPLSRQTNGMPSGHTAASVLAAVLAARCFGLDHWFTCLATVVMAVVAWQRIHDKFHSGAQVLVGTAIGVAMAWVWC